MPRAVHAALGMPRCAGQGCGIDVTRIKTRMRSHATHALNLNPNPTHASPTHCPYPRYEGRWIKEYIDATVPEMAFGEYWDTCSYTGAPACTGGAGARAGGLPRLMNAVPRASPRPRAGMRPAGGLPAGMARPAQCRTCLTDT